MTAAVVAPEAVDPDLSVAEALSQVGLSERAIELLQLVRPGIDIWEPEAAVALRALERLGLVLIGPADFVPKSGAGSRPYFACIISDTGKLVLQQTLKARLTARSTTP